MNINYFPAAEARAQVLDNYYAICPRTIDDIMTTIREATDEGAYDCMIPKEFASPLTCHFLEELGYKIITPADSLMSKKYTRISWRKD